MAVPAQQPYSVQLDAETARNLAINGSTILLLGVPETTPVGIDQQVFLTGPRFKGIKMMPPGVHLLSYQARSRRDGTLSPPISTFLMLKPRQVLVRRWNPATEGLVELEEEEAARYAAGVANFDFDRELAPYDLARYSQWAALSCHISTSVLQQLLPPGGEISIMAEALDPGLMNPRSAAERRLQQQLEEGRAQRAAAMQVDRADEPPHQQPSPAGPAAEQQQQPPPVPQQQQQQQQQVASQADRCRYTPLPRVLKVPGASAAQLTAANIDKTTLLEQALQRYRHAPADSSYSSSSRQQQQAEQQPAGGAAREELDVLGELQFAFIAFVFGQSLEGYMQWKQLLVLLLGCVSGPLESHTSLFVQFLTALTAQLQLGLGLGSGSTSRQASAGTQESGVGAALLGEGLVEELLPDSFLKQCFRGFFEMLQESGAEAPAALLAQARVLEALLASGLGWDFRMTDLLGSDDSGSDDEFRPVVVELTEQQLADLQAAGST